MRITVDPYTTAGSVKFYVRRISEECKIAQSAQIAHVQMALHPRAHLMMIDCNNFAPTPCSHQKT